MPPMDSCAYDDSSSEDYLPSDVMAQLAHLPVRRSLAWSAPSWSVVDPEHLRLAEGFSEWWDEEA